MTMLIRKVRDRSRDRLQTHGTAKAKQRLWDAEFTNGRWDCLDTTADDFVYSRIETTAKGGSVLDLGCGAGSTASELNEEAYRQYVGVDVSQVAIDKAQRRIDGKGLAHKCGFVRGDIATYKPTEQYDAILFRDSLYYIKRSQFKAVLMRYSRWLKQDGCFIVRIWDGKGKLKEIVDTIRQGFDVTDEEWHQKSHAVVLVFRCQAGSGNGGRCHET